MSVTAGQQASSPEDFPIFPLWIAPHRGLLSVTGGPLRRALGATTHGGAGSTPASRFARLSGLLSPATINSNCLEFDDDRCQLSPLHHAWSR
jgi:hypothetical protein